MTPYWLVVALQGHKGRAGVLGEPGSIGKTVSNLHTCTQTPIHVHVVQPCTLTHHWGSAEARISSNEAPRGTWLALIWLRLVRPGPGPAVSMQRARWKGWWRARYMKGRMRESGIAQPSHLAVLSRANEHTVGSKGAASQAPGISLWSSHTRRRSKQSTHQVTTPPRQTSVVEALTQGFTVVLLSVFFFLKTTSTSCLHPH